MNALIIDTEADEMRTQADHDEAIGLIATTRVR
jgi:hypothetical protein